jgi:hypothetical protein
MFGSYEDGIGYIFENFPFEKEQQQSSTSLNDQQIISIQNFST